jgi:hypothetical protein
MFISHPHLMYGVSRYPGNSRDILQFLGRRRRCFRLHMGRGPGAWAGKARLEKHWAGRQRIRERTGWEPDGLVGLTGMDAAAIEWSGERRRMD